MMERLFGAISGLPIETRRRSRLYATDEHRKDAAELARGRLALYEAERKARMASYERAWFRKGHRLPARVLAFVSEQT